MRFLKSSIVAMAAVSMAAAPAIASSASSLSVTQVARSGADVTDASELQGGFIIPLIAILAIIAGIAVAVGGGDEGPTSP